MPKVVDYAERRDRIAEAVVELVSRDGFEAATLRDVAAQAGVSMGAAQRCFRTKDEMLSFALRHITQRLTAQAEAAIAAASQPESAAVLLAATMRVLALVEPEHRREARVWTAFVAQAAVSPPLAAILAETYGQIHDLLVWLVGFGQQTGEFRADLNPEHEAGTLLPLAEGLTAIAATGHRDTGAALAVLDRYLDRLTV